jgi:hypothetical protein
MKKRMTFFLQQSIVVIYLFGGVRNTTGIFLTTYNTNEFIFHKSDTAYRIIDAASNTYGYEILINYKAIIRQLNIPGEPGANGFKTKSDAEKVARLVVKKIRLGIMPPSIEKIELDRLRINY